VSLSRGDAAKGLYRWGDIPTSVLARSFATLGETGRVIRFSFSRGHLPSAISCGEDRSRLLPNNSEHLCEWCLRGTARSFQIEGWLARARLTLVATLCLIIRVPMSSFLR
jgi:hypothetical protein